MILKWILVQTAFELQNGLLLNVDKKILRSVRFTPQEMNKKKSKIGVHLGKCAQLPWYFAVSTQRQP